MHSQNEGLSASGKQAEGHLFQEHHAPRVLPLTLIVDFQV
jgi:hypothetical protein